MKAKTSWYIFGSILCLVCSASFAEEGTRPERTKNYIEELTVLGERDKETLSDESHSVAVFTSEELEVATQRTFTDLFERIPNATTNRQNEPVIRGIPQFGIDTGTRGSITTTTFYRDGLGILVAPVLWDAYIAEVSRGPQSELRPSVGGVLAVGTTDPTDLSSGRARVAYGPGAGDQEFGLAVGGPLLRDWAGRLSLYNRQRDGHTTNVTHNDDAWDRYEETLARAKFLWKPSSSPDTTVRFLAEFIERDQGGGAEVRGSANNPMFDPFDRHAVADTDARRRERTPALVVDITHDFGNAWLFNWALGTTSKEERGVADADGTSQTLSVVVTDTDLDAIGTVLIAYHRGDEWLVRFRQRVTQLETDFRQDNRSPFDADGPGPLPGVTTSTLVLVPWPEFYNWTSQISASRHFGRLRFAGSLTFEGDTTGEDFSITTTATSTGIPDVDGIYDFVVQQFFPQVVGKKDTRSSDLLPMASLSWSLDDRTIVGAKLERARRAGGVTVNIARKTLDSYDRELSDNLDIYLRATRLSNRLSITSTLFVTRVQDLQLAAALTTTPFDSQVVNARRARTAGAELEIGWWDINWRAFATAGWLKTELDDIQIGITDISGNEYPNAPRWSVSMGASYDPGHGLFAAIDVSAQAEAFGSFDNRAGNRSDARRLLNARVGWRWSHAALSLYARNLFDDEYHNYSDLDLPGGINQVFQPGNPRELGVTLEARW